LRYLTDGTAVDDGYGVGESHRDQCLATFAMVGVPANYPIEVKGLIFRVDDLVSESAKNVSLSQRELPWTAIALVHYLLPKNSWTDRFGELHSFDEVLGALVARGCEGQCCGGLHVVHAVQAIVDASQKHSILKTESATNASNFLADLRKRVLRSQSVEGFWDSGWLRNRQVENATLAEKVAVSSHILEWLYGLPKSAEPEIAVTKGKQWLRNELLGDQNRDKVRSIGVCPQRWLVEAGSYQTELRTNKSQREVRYALARRIIVATADERLRYFVGHPDGTRGIDFKWEPYNLDIRIENQSKINFQVFNRVISKSEFVYGSAIEDPIRRDILFFFLPVWPLGRYEAPRIDDLGLILPLNSLIESDRYTVTKETQRIDGESCRVVLANNGRDRLWLSEERDSLLLKRCWDVDAAGSLKAELLVKETAEFSPGLHIPVDVDVTYFVQAAHNDTLVPLNRIRTHVYQFSIDERSCNAALDLKLPPGTLDVSPSSYGQVSTGGCEHLYDLASFYKTKLNLPAKKSAWLYSGRLICGLALGSLIGYASILGFNCLRRWTVRSMRKRSGKA